MNTPPLPPNPSQSVERIREIIVGRQLERLEDRITRLEAPGAVHSAPVDDRLTAAEARIEALQSSLRQLGEAARLTTLQREEIQRIIEGIRHLPPGPPGQPPHPLEQRLGNWLRDWQKSFHQHAQSREQQLTQRLQDEIATLRNWTEARITGLETAVESLHRRLDQVATAAQALATAATRQAVIPDP